MGDDEPKRLAPEDQVIENLWAELEKAEIDERIQSEEYLALVRRAFRNMG
jgi:hypothetical protein